MGFMYVNPNIALDNGLQNAMWSSNSGPAGSRTNGQSIKSNQVQRTEGADLKLQQIINKFKRGKKLSAKEMSYLASKAPELYQKVLRITQEREQLEQEMEAADSKEEVSKIVAEKMGSIEKISGGDEFEETARTNQYNDAYSAYMKTDEYKSKPESERAAAKNTLKDQNEETIEELEEKLRKKYKRRRSQLSQDSSLLKNTMQKTQVGSTLMGWEEVSESVEKNNQYKLDPLVDSDGKKEQSDGQAQKKKTYLRTGLELEGQEHISGKHIDVAF